MPARTEPLDRWRLVLGRFSEKALGDVSGGELSRMESALDYIYSREYRGRGVREDKGRGGGLGASQLSVPKWLAESEKLFPKETVEILERHALDRYGMTELIEKAETLRRLEPNLELLSTLLRFKGRMKPEVMGELRRIINAVVAELRRKLETEVKNVLAGRLNRFRRSRLRIHQNLNWRDTLRRNLKYYDPERRKLIVQELSFYSRVERKLPWTLILCVDQSGSMASSVIHSAVMAGIFAGLPSLELKLVVFDTAVVDLSEHASDPVEVLMSVQLGGGTNIGQALAYCEGLVKNPRRTALILVSDFEEGASPRKLVAQTRRLREGGVVLLGLAALDDAAEPVYDRRMAERLALSGMEIAALTPRSLAEWLAGILR